jgi:hypothetical protein
MWLVPNSGSLRSRETRISEDGTYFSDTNTREGAALGYLRIIFETCNEILSALHSVINLSDSARPEFSLSTFPPLQQFLFNRLKIEQGLW